MLDLLDFKWLTNRLLEKKVDLTILFSNPFCVGVDFSLLAAVMFMCFLFQGEIQMGF